MALIIIILNITEIPGALFDIIQNAFGLKTAVSGGIGAALIRGMRRGFFPIFTRVLDDFRTQIKAGEEAQINTAQVHNTKTAGRAIALPAVFVELLVSSIKKLSQEISPLE